MGKSASRRAQKRARRGRHKHWSERTQSLHQFVREYTAGLNTREVKRLFGRDAVSAYSVLTRDHAEEIEPKQGLKRVLFRAKLAFLGLSYKLTPPRRMLFAASLVGVVLSFVVTTIRYDSLARDHITRVSVDFSPFWLFLSVCCLVLLLALELVDRIRVRDELEVARELQAELLPHGRIELSGYTCAHSYRTANEVGGDYYEVTTLPDGRVALMVGDATGHGMASGLVMAIANATLKTAMDLDPDPRYVLKLLNRTLFRTGSRRTFMTVFYALLTPATGELVAISAGHPYPLLRRANGRMEELGTPGLPLGVRPDLAPEPQTTTMAPGDMLLLYTDGLAEAVDRQTEAFSYQRIAALTEIGGTPQAVHDRILTAFDSHVGDEPLRDDLTLLVIARDDRNGGHGGDGAVRDAFPPAPTPTTAAAKVAAIAAALGGAAGGTGTRGAADAPGATDAPRTSGTFGTFGTPGTFSTPNAPGTPDAPGTSDAPGAPDATGSPDATGAIDRPATEPGR
jgi:sigma-B regulation protein RsbU (phosphoserine phosphatase)